MGNLTIYDYSIVILIVVIGILLWKYRKEYLKIVIQRLVINMEAEFVEGSGIKKAIEAKNKFIQWVNSKSKIAGYFLKICVTDKDLEDWIKEAFEKMKEDILKIRLSREKVAQYVTDSITNQLMSLDIPSSDKAKISMALQDAEKSLVTDKGYIEAFAQYSEKTKFSAGVKVQAKF